MSNLLDLDWKVWKLTMLQALQGHFLHWFLSCWDDATSLSWGVIFSAKFKILTHGFLLLPWV